MAVVGTLSSLNLIAGAGILGNVGGVPIAANIELSNSISTYTSVGVVSQFSNIASNGYISIGIVANTFPALTNVVPTAYQSDLGSGTMTGAINTQSTKIMCGGDLGKFSQVFNAGQALVSQTNQLINSTLNANSVENTTAFTSNDNLMTGGLSGVTLAFPSFSEDLGKLGFLIDLNNLNNLGTPSSILKQIDFFTNLPPGLRTALLNAGLPEDLVDNLQTSSVTDSQEKIIYEVMTQITGNALTQVLTLLRVTTTGITNMADLLNPIKIFPNSFNTLTAPTANGLRGIYINATGTVNSLLSTTLPDSVLNPLQGNPLQNMTVTQ